MRKLKMLREQILYRSLFATLAGFVLVANSFTNSVRAENSVIINQLGPGSIEVNQSGNKNSVEISQSPNDSTPTPYEVDTQPMPAPLGSPADINSDNYQQEVLKNPYTSPRARAEILKKEPTEKVLSPKESIAKAKEILSKEERSTSKIKVKQEGGKNSTTVSQRSKHNDLLLEQDGEENNAERLQMGEHNHSRIIQNGEVIEDR